MERVETRVAQAAPSSIVVVVGGGGGRRRPLETGVEQQVEKGKDIFPFSRLRALVIPALFWATEQHHLVGGG